MILEGAILGGFTLAGGAITFSRLPEKVKSFIVRHPVMTECVMVVFFYEVMGMTVIAHVAVAFMTLGAMALFHIARNKEQYQFLFDAVDEGKKKMSSALDKLKELNARHMERKRMEAAQEVK